MPWVTRKNGTRRFYYRLSREYGRRRVWINDPIAAAFIDQNTSRSRRSPDLKPGSLSWLFRDVSHSRGPAQEPDKGEPASKREAEREGSHQESH
jgi:hypothetical protein